MNGLLTTLVNLFPYCLLQPYQCQTMPNNSKSFCSLIFFLSFSPTPLSCFVFWGPVNLQKSICWTLSGEADTWRPRKCKSQEWVGPQMVSVCSQQGGSFSFKRREVAPSSTEPLPPLQWQALPNINQSDNSLCWGSRPTFSCMEDKIFSGS